MQIWETDPAGGVMFNGINPVSPEGHADMAFQLAQSTEQEAWDVPFITTNGEASRAPKDLVFATPW
jgi:hypothetical protein